MEHQQELVLKAQQGEAQALAELRNQLQPPLLGILLARGAGQLEAEEILADLWSDCVPGAAEGTPLLARFKNGASLLAWLARVAVNRWIDRRRREARTESQAPVEFDEMPGCPTTPADNILQAALRDSLRTAFAACSSEAILMLRLVYLHGLTQREVGRMVGWSEPKTSRALSRAMQQIQQQTLKHLKAISPGLELRWEDFLELCDSQEIDFL